MNYTKLNNVMNYIPKSLREVQNDDDQWLSWALQALRTVNTHELVSRDFALLEIEDHKVCLPKGLKRITSIRKLEEDFVNDANIASLNKCIGITPADTDNPDIADINDDFSLTEDGTSRIYYFNDACALNVQLFQASSYYNDAMKPMRYKGVTGKSYFTSDCYWQVTNGECYTGFSITTDGCLMVDAATGLICLEYECEVRDDDGNFLVPNHPVQLWQGMGQYAIAQHWLNRTGFKEANAYNMYQAHLAHARSYMREAKSIFRQKNIDFKLLSAITYRDVNMINLPSVWSFKITP